MWQISLSAIFLFGAMRMRRGAALSIFVLLLLGLSAVGLTHTGTRAESGQENAPKATLRVNRSSPLDLQIEGHLSGIPKRSKRYVRREDLLALPQVTFTATGDPNFGEPVKVRGVELDALARAVAADREHAVVVAICKDWYRSYYPPAYRDAHKPALALEINDQPPDRWPKLHSSSGVSMAPYLITQAQFAPSFKILGHEDEAQIPWGVLRLEFADEKTVFGPVEPRGPNARDPAVQAGYHIAQQNCLRCHGPESDEPLKGKLTWAGIALFASQAPKNFAAYVREPKAQSKDAQMPPNPTYDDATLQALTAYFRTFAAPETR